MSDGQTASGAFRAIREPQAGYRSTSAARPARAPDLPAELVLRVRSSVFVPQLEGEGVYELEPAGRARLAAPAAGVAPLAVGDGLDAGVWASHEFGVAPLGDARLVQSAQHMAQCPMRAITGATNGARALVKGHYRLIDQPADSAVTVDNILEPHRERTLRRMRAHDTVLCIQDGTRLNFTRRGQTLGLGAIGSDQTGAVARGLHLHTTLAVNPDGVALGVLRAAFDAPAPPNRDEKGQPPPKPREERTSFRLGRRAARLRAGGRAAA